MDFIQKKNFLETEISHLQQQASQIDQARSNIIAEILKKQGQLDLVIGLIEESKVNDANRG